MKSILLSVASFVFAVTVYGQVKIGGTGLPDASAVLHLESGGNKGLLLPTVTAAGLAAMNASPKGLIVFNSSDSALYIKRDTGWVQLAAYTAPLWERNSFGDMVNTMQGGQKKDVGVNSIGIPRASLDVGPSGYPNEPSLKVTGQAIFPDSLAIGASTVVAPFSVGSTGSFRINNAGNITKLNNVPLSFPASQGTAGSMLTNDGTGNLAWRNEGFENMRVFALGTSTFTVPAGVTKIRVEIYSGGGKGSPAMNLLQSSVSGGVTYTDYSLGSGGGGGGYAEGSVNVVPGTIMTVIVPSGGQDNFAKISIPAGDQIIITNGHDAYKAATLNGSEGEGGKVTVQTGIFANCSWFQGNPGLPNINTLFNTSLVNNSSYDYTFLTFGNGGSSPFLNNGGRGGFRQTLTSFNGITPTAVTTYTVRGTEAGYPGGGGSGQSVSNGAPGKVVFYY